MSLSDTASFWRRYLLLHLVALGLLAAWLTTLTVPVDLPDLHLAGGERLKCVSYAPYHLPGQTPLDPTQSVPRAQIEADLKALSAITGCVRIYAVSQGLEYVPPVARELGMKVLLGAWIGRETAKNRLQLDTAVALANEYPDVVRAVIVGNEVMLRREQSEDALRAMIDETKARVRVPVTYADVWEFWLKHPSLAGSVDFLTIHILPYWEDQPIAIDQALDHVASIRERMMKAYGKPVLIGETGWPSAGRQREGSRPGRIEQARFIRSFVRRAHDNDWDYNLIEALDQPWKRNLEGTVGGYWGMLDTELHPHFPLAGPVAERPQGMGGFAWAAALGGLFALLAGWGDRRRDPALLRLPALAVGGAWAGGVLLLAWEHAVIAYRNPFEWGLLGAIAVLAASLPLWFAGCAALPRLPLAWTAWRSELPGRTLALVRGFLLLAAAVTAVLLLFDPRYRDFPYWLYATPALAFAVLRRGGGIEEQLCALLILIGGVGRWLMEPFNPQAVAWLGLCLLLAWGGGLGTRQHQQG